MARKLNVSLLAAKDIDYAFPLIRTTWPAAELEGWRHFAEHRLAAGPDSGTGILVVRNEQDCIAGIAAFALAEDLIHGRVLVADPFSAVDFIDQGNIARALEGGLEKIARRHGCAAVHVNVATAGCQGGDDWLSAILHERGHRIEGLHMCKLIPVVA